MAVIMENQFQKLQDIILNQVDRFYFENNLTMVYLGPVKPSSIISFYNSSKVIHINALVLAESVPASNLPYKYNSINSEAVIIHLDENFEFNQYDPQTKELFQLGVLVGDPDYSYDGTVDGAKAFFADNNLTLEVLYRKFTDSSSSKDQ
jgi:hypothetical protein